jgi:hypothetical protein
LEVLGDSLTGLADTNTQVAIEFAPFAIDVGGSLSLDGVVYDELQLERLSGNYHVNADALTLADVTASLYGGAIAGQAAIPFSESLPGTAFSAYVVPRPIVRFAMANSPISRPSEDSSSGEPCGITSACKDRAC